MKTDNTTAGLAPASGSALGRTPEIHARRRQLLRWLPNPDATPKQPMDLGGRNGSHHSGDLGAMAKRGLVEKVRWGGWDRGSYRYRRTAAGDVYLQNTGGEPRSPEKPTKP